MTYDAVILDNDGVLTALTDASVMERAVADAFGDMGVVDPDPADVERLVYGVTPEILRSVAGRYGLSPTALWYRRDLRSSLVQEREIRAGRKPLYPDVEALSRIDRPLGIVSSNQYRTVETILEQHGIGERFDAVHGREMHPRSLARKKPDPHYLDLAIGELGARNPLFVGDSESDVQAAAAAGIDSVFLRRAHRAGMELEVPPTHEIETLADLPAIVEAAG
ncbi:MAG: HAD family hydrolase [Halodesulfurarchaeum sp.]